MKGGVLVGSGSGVAPRPECESGLFLPSSWAPGTWELLASFPASLVDLESVSALPFAPSSAL